MKIFIVFSLTVLAVCQAAIETEQLNEEWINFQKKFAKTYKSPIEARRRMSIFAENLEKIAAHNALYERGESTFEMGVTKFSDLTEQEFLDEVTTVLEDQPIDYENMFRASENIEDVPESIDWRELGKVSEVKDQGQCGSCWSFSATGALESLVRIHYDREMSLSEQNLIDCAVRPNYTSGGCSGGLMTEAFKYVRDHGIETEQEYAYTGKDGKCEQTRRVMSISGYTQVEPNEEALRQAVAKQPVSVGIEVRSAFQQYKGGVMYDPTCTQGANHGVLVVGYGNENGQDYWLVKNSWGPSFGEKGFIKMARNRDSNCWIAKMASFPYIN